MGLSETPPQSRSQRTEKGWTIRTAHLRYSALYFWQSNTGTYLYKIVEITFFFGSQANFYYIFGQIQIQLNFKNRFHQ